MERREVYTTQQPDGTYLTTTTRTQTKYAECEDALVTEFKRVPCKRVGQPEDVAEAILFLADRKRSSYIIGHQLVVDGGSSLYFPLQAEGPEVLAGLLGRSNPIK